MCVRGSVNVWTEYQKQNEKVSTPEWFRNNVRSKRGHDWEGKKMSRGKVQGERQLPKNLCPSCLYLRKRSLHLPRDILPAWARDDAEQATKAKQLGVRGLASTKKLVGV